MPARIDLSTPRSRHSILLGCVMTIFVIGCCAVTLLGWARGFMVAVQGSVTISAPATDTSALSLGVASMREITVRGSDGEIITATVVGLPQGGSHPVRFESGDAGLRLVLPAESDSASLTLDVPSRIALQIEIDRGDLEVEDMAGQLDLRVNEGQITIRNHSGSAAVAATVGTGQLLASLRSLNPEATVVLTTSQGDLTLEIPDGIGFAFDGVTEAGRLRISGVTITPGEPMPVAAGESLVGVAEPQRGRAIRLRAGTGDIFLQAR